jgi:hypothetical protein
MLSRALNFRPAMLAFETVAAIQFILQPTLTTMDWKFHLEHSLMQHFAGTLTMFATLAMMNGSFPAARELLTGSK